MYWRRALTHYVQIVSLGVAIILYFISSSFLCSLGFLLVAESCIMLGLTRLKRFRHEVDEAAHRSACTLASAVRTATLARMLDDHRKELERLEVLATRTRSITSVENGANDDWLGLDTLLASFVRLAIAYRESATAFDVAAEAALLDYLSRASRAAPASGPVASVRAQRLAIMRGRVDSLRRAREERELIAEELATISETVRWTHEQAALGRSAEAHAGVADAVASCTRHGTALRELSELQGQGMVDADMLRLGRGERIDVTRLRVQVDAPPAPALVEPIEVVEPQQTMGTLAMHLYSTRS
jgi:hypothetical protein